MSAPTDHTLDYQAISDLLSDVRQRIRTFVWAEAVLLALVLVGVVFWGGLLLDWMFEPPPQVRLAVHLLLVASVLGILIWWGLRRWMVGLSDRSLALLIERKHPELQDALSVAVDLHESPADAANVHPELAARTIREAAHAARSLNTENLLNQLRINRFALLVGGLAISVIALALGMPKIWDTYTQRLALSPEDWPRRVGLTVEGFEPDGEGGWFRKVARNSDVPVVVNASLAEELEAPERVTIRYRWEEGRRGRDDLIRIGDAEPGRDESQRYEYLFERIAGNVEFDIRGGDDRVRHLRLEVVERPKVTQLQFECEYPEYLGRSNRIVAAGPRVELPEGTVITAVGKANKPLAEVRWRLVVQDDEPQMSSDATSDFESHLKLERNDIDLEVELLDEDGIVSAEPFRVTLASRLDEKPQVLASREGIGLAVTQRAQLPVQLDITDDNGVNTAWLDIRHGDDELPRMPVNLPAGSRNKLLALATVDLEELAQAHPNDPLYAFAPGGQVTIAPSANDKFDLSDESRATAARNLTFEIVTEDELLSRLAGSEQNLRQTFEAVADKLLLLYDSVEKLEQQALGGSVSATEDADLLVVDTSAEPPENAEIAPETIDESEAQSHLARDAVRDAETARQIADEVQGVAAGFEDIHAQLFNNRVDNGEMSNRIGNRIAAPLRKLGEQRMTSVADKIARVATGESTTAAKQEMRQAIIEVEELLREMKGLENYNEIVAMLREIIRQQEQINTKTKDQQKSDLKDLLLD
ncbi:hypothetical protein NG895_28805 [Aeoliella sp. ICT_H6.2]|uniref:Uncharacterized protein n=1 Tax=Aeoliella straminimaris TaxID=2954799 RepID=A0A9X2JL25_9BACT|nr:hypothetical protein [Aeoliella straminimaris]MCO6047924.1 hypothetical protein [Aeoliella straminimaris]